MKKVIKRLAIFLTSSTLALSASFGILPKKITPISSIYVSATDINWEKLENEIDYEITNGEVSIIHCNRFAISIDIPAKIKDCPVTSIGHHAFENCQNLKSITLPDSVTSIKYNAFKNC